MRVQRSRAGPSERRPGAATVLVALLTAGALAGGCTYAVDEPGLFERTGPVEEHVRPAPPTRSPAPDPDPDLPVLAERTWSTADGSQVQVRIAVHALRRIAGATVLDWSITPIAVPNLGVGDQIPESTDLGLARDGDARPRIHLLDATGGRLYRPLVGSAGGVGCVCTPLAPVLPGLRVGHTTGLQVAFPSLPADLATVDVAYATLAPFPDLPLTAPGRVPWGERPVALGRPVDADPRGQRSPMFRYGAEGQVFRVRSDRLWATETVTVWSWTIWSVTGGPGLTTASDGPLPFAEPDVVGLGGGGSGGSGGAGPVSGPGSASGPVLAVGTGADEQVLRPRLVSTDGGGSVRECLCTPLGGWADWLRRPDKPASVMTVYPPLPAGATQVRVRVQGVGDLTVPVEATPDLGLPPVTDRPWTPVTWATGRQRDGSAGWTDEYWPTAIPAPEVLGGDPGEVGRFAR